MREHWHQHHRIQCRVHNGTAAGKRVGGGACGCGDDEPIGTLPVHEHAVDGQLELDHLRRCTGVHHHIVECIGPADRLALTHHAGIEQKAALPGIFACQYRRHLHGNVVRADIGQETQPAPVDPKHRRFVLRQRTGGTEQAAVASHHDHQIAVFADLIQAGPGYGGILHQLGEARLQHKFLAQALQQTHQLAQHIREALLLAATHQAYPVEFCVHGYPSLPRAVRATL